MSLGKNTARGLAVLGALSFGLTVGCERDAGDHLDDAMDSAEDAAESLGDAAEQAAEDAADELDPDDD